MNIALFLDCYTPMKNGVITSALQLKEGLEKKGHHVVLVAVKTKGYVNNDPNVLLFPKLSFDFTSKQGFGLGLVNFMKLIKFLKKHKIKLIHTHTEFGLGLAGKYAAKKLKIPRIATSHTMWEEYGNYSSLLKSKTLSRNFLKFYYKGVSAIVTPSIKSKNFNDKVVPEITKEIIPNGIDFEKIKNLKVNIKQIDELKKTNEIDKNDKILLFVGRLGAEKRVVELLNSIVPLLKKDKSIKMFFVGDGPESEKLWSIAKENHLRKQIIFTGFVNWEKLPKFYFMADIFLTASLSEVHPMTVIEANMYGLPIIARKDESFSGLVENNENGYLLDSDEKFAQSIEELLSDEKKLKRFGKCSLKIGEKFTLDKHIENIEVLYKDSIFKYKLKVFSKNDKVTEYLRKKLVKGIPL